MPLLNQGTRMSIRKYISLNVLQLVVKHIMKYLYMELLAQPQDTLRMYLLYNMERQKKLDMLLQDLVDNLLSLLIHMILILDGSLLMEDGLK